MEELIRQVLELLSNRLKYVCSEIKFLDHSKGLVQGGKIRRENVSKGR
jgi:hypothetical protein